MEGSRSDNELKKATTIERTVVRKLLLDLQGDTGRWPTDEDFEQAWLSTPAYQVFGSSRTQVILEAIDLQMMTSKQEALHIGSATSIEHVLPQFGTEEDWPLTLTSNSEEARQDANRHRHSLIHTFGNLTLVTQERNSELSNGPFSAKCPVITRQSSLRMNAYFQDFLNGSPWNEAAIVQRGKVLLQVAKEIWPRPTPSG